MKTRLLKYEVRSVRIVEDEYTATGYTGMATVDDWDEITEQSPDDIGQCDIPVFRDYVSSILDASSFIASGYTERFEVYVRGTDDLVLTVIIPPELQHDFVVWDAIMEVNNINKMLANFERDLTYNDRIYIDWDMEEICSECECSFDECDCGLEEEVCRIY